MADVPVAHTRVHEFRDELYLLNKKYADTGYRAIVLQPGEWDVHIDHDGRGHHLRRVSAERSRDGRD